MYKNVVIFGPTSSGKSTLMGYLLCHEREEKENNEIFKNIKKEILREGLEYHPDRKLAYLVDTSKEERRDNSRKKNKGHSGQNKRGSSTRIHICKAKVGEDECTFIETPGSDQYWIDKNEGIFLGDIGVYVIEIKDLLALTHKVENSSSYKITESKIFSSMYLWKHYKNISRLVIAISKIDLAYSKFAIEKSIKILQSVDVFRNVRIVPISIDVNNVKECNIYNISPEVADVYNGNTLMEHIREIILNDSRNDSIVESNFAHIHKIFEVQKKNLQKAIAYRVKVLSGKIALGDRVGMGPLKGEDGKSVHVEGIVKSIKHEVLGNVSCLNKGDVGGIILSQLKVDGKIKKEDCIKRTTVLYDLDASQVKGNLIFLSVNLKDEKEMIKEEFRKLNLNDRIKIIWFGKLITMDLVGKIVSDECKEEYKIILMNYNSSTDYSEFLLTMNQNRNLIFNSFVIQLPSSYYVSAEITDIDCISQQNPGNVEFSCPYENIVKMFKKFLNSKNISFNYKITPDEELSNSMYFKNIFPENISGLMGVLRKFIKYHGISDFKLDITDRSN